MSILIRPAFAILPGVGARSDAKRFHLDRRVPPVRHTADAASLAELAKFKKSHNARWKVRYDARTGALSMLRGGQLASGRPGAPEVVARSFLQEQATLTGVDATTLSVLRQNSAFGQNHILFSQSYRGLPVEFARVKVHLNKDNAVVGFESSYEPNLNLPTNPSISLEQAALAVQKDCGSRPQGGSLVILGSRALGKPSLAWKFEARGRRSSWTYYVDAQTGAVLFRTSNREFVCGQAGTVNGYVYMIDPSSSGLSLQPFANEKIYVGDASTYTLTDANGDYCTAPGRQGKISAQLQGQYVNVANYLGPGAHYDNGGMGWASQPLTASSPHPYPNNADLSSTMTVTASTMPIVAVAPVFTNFQMGAVTANQLAGGEGGDITDDDETAVLDADGHFMGSYVGDLTQNGSLTGAIAPGTTLSLLLRSNSSGQSYGYDMGSVLYLTLGGAAGYVPGPTNIPGAISSFTWTQTGLTYRNLHSEISLYYHLNAAHDYLVGDVDGSGAANLDGPAPAMALLPPSVINAFYDPEYNVIAFGDLNDTVPSDAFADDATVPHHEFTHYMVNQIMPIVNFGESGALSEANADYFSATELNDPGIGAWVVYSLAYQYSTAYGTPLRQLDDQNACPNSPCEVLSNGSWVGEIHADSVYLSQALWDVRKNLIKSLNSYADGVSCADRLEFQAWFYYPESFAEIEQALLDVDQTGGPGGGQLQSKGGVACNASSYINTYFALHAIDFLGVDANSGFQTALDVSTTPTVTATIGTTGQTNFYTFGSAAGMISISMTLPVSPDGANGGYYSGYMLTLYDDQNNQLAQAIPAINGFNDIGNMCASADCTTSQQIVTLSYNATEAEQYYLEVSGGPTLDGSISGVNNPLPYTLSFSYPQAQATAAALINASFDNDTISFSANVGAFPAGKPLYSFDCSGANGYVQLRDQAQNVMEQTQTNEPGSLLACASGGVTNGTVSGSVTIQPGFAARYPAVGTVYVEVFASSTLHDVVSLGLSNPINLATNQTSFSAWNNVFDPLRGQHATIKYQIQQSGHVTIRLYTLSGRLVTTLLDNNLPAGEGSIDWAGQNSAGSTVASGVYIAHIDGPGISQTQKIIVVK